jgi:hypothetical protein
MRVPLEGEVVWVTAAGPSPYLARTRHGTAIRAGKIGWDVGVARDAGRKRRGENDLALAYRPPEDPDR